MTVKTSPSDNGDCQQQTFDKLRRKPVPDAYYEYVDLLKDLMFRDDIKLIDSTHPDAAKWLVANGWDVKELIVAHGEWLSGLESGDWFTND